MMDKRTIVSRSNTKSKILKLKVSAKEKEGVRRKLVTTASKLASTAKEKESVRSKLATTARALAVTARERESVRRKLVITANKLASTAQEKETVRRKLATTAKTLAATAKEKESVRRRLAVTAQEKESVRSKLATTAKALAATAKEKESVRNELAVTAREKESVRQKLETTAKALAVTASEKESVRRKLETTANELAATARKLKESYSTLEKKVHDRTKDLEVSKAKDEALLASIGEGIIAMDENRKIILFNNKAAQILGLSGRDILGKDAYETLRIEDEQGNFIPEKERPLHAAFSVAAYTNTSITKGIHYYYSRKDKPRVPVSITVSPVIINNKIVGAVEAFHDITEEKEIDRQKSEFISLASHQLRTPLGSMRWNLELLQEDVKPLPEAARERLHEAYKSNLRVIRLVGDLLNVTRIEQGRVKDEPQLTELVEIFQSAAKEMQPEALKRKVTLDVKIKKPQIPKISIDPNFFREVIQNILSNAVKYTLEGGRVSVEVDSTDNSIEFSVEDNGIGIPVNEQSRIFTKFARAENATRIDTGGSGLGLFIVKSFIDKWGGKIWFKSEQDKGTTFYVSLPLVPQVMNPKVTI